jgi:alpha,alpha-trehalase
MLNDLAEAESGWDMNTRFNRKCLDFIPIDLNCLLYKYELDFARAYELFGDQDTASLWKEHAQKRKLVVNSELWSSDNNFFFDLDYTDRKHSKVWSLAPYFSLWTGLASDEQAKSLVGHLDKFLHEGGLTASSAPDEMPDSDIPHQWAYPNGWAPLHWLTIEGLQKYGYTKEAQDIARRWIETNTIYYETYGVFREAYNVVNSLKEPRAGLYPPQLGFGWTNGVYVDLAKKFLSPEELVMV